MIIMTVSGDRPAYLAEVLASWSAARGADVVPFGFAVEPGDRLDECREVIAAFAAGRSGPTEVRVNDRRLGVLHNPHHALAWAFGTGAAFVVAAEEDIVVGDDVLEFLGAQDAAHADDPEVLAVCAFSDRPAPQPADVVTDGHFVAWVWGTWSDRWTSCLGPRWFDAARPPAGSLDSGWDFGVLRIAAADGLRVLTPLASRSDNIGREGGVHALPEDFEASRAPTFAAHRAPVRFREERPLPSRT